VLSRLYKILTDEFIGNSNECLINSDIYLINLQTILQRYYIIYGFSAIIRKTR